MKEYTDHLHRNHFFVVGEPSSSKNAFLRSSEGLFFLTILEGKTGEMSPVGEIGGGLVLDEGGEFASSRTSLGVMIDIVVSWEEWMEGMSEGRHCQ